MKILEGDCREVMAKATENSIDAIVTDPPYGLEFMGKEWDRLGEPKGFRRKENPADVGRNNVFGRTSRTSPEYAAKAQMQAWHEAWAVEALRVLKPGGHLVAFGGTRTYHRLACAIEDAGFEVRDCLMWLYGTGFPKSLDVGKAIDKAAGVTERPITGEKRGAERLRNQAPDGTRDGAGRWGNEGGRDPFTRAAVTDAARQWQGWGTALKPAWEPIILARKPLTGTVAANVQEFGTGAINVGACRIETNDCLNGGTFGGVFGNGKPTIDKPIGTGRWPANLVLDFEAGEMLDAQSEPKMHGAGRARTGSDDTRKRGCNASSYEIKKAPSQMHRLGDSGGASRFFYCAKASKKERGEGNNHPTVKPVSLMRWLVRLVTPPGGKILDPFAGSGTTGVAAKAEGFDFVGIEQSPEYAAIARKRIEEGIE